MTHASCGDRLSAIPDRPLTYDEAQVSPRPCHCGRLVSRPEQCAAWRAARDGVTCPYQVLHQRRD